jgi:transcription elongation factor Elf1
MRDVNTKIMVDWTCERCGTRNSYSATRTDVDTKAAPGIHRQKCSGCERGKEAELTAELVLR